jgi:release factor glutamine methyltransferase
MTVEPMDTSEAPALDALLRQASHRVGRIDAQWLLCHALGRDATWLVAHGRDRAQPHVQAAFEAMVVRREAGEPVAYLTGRRGFWSLDLEVDGAVLIPRPETELLVELALQRLPADAPLHVADLGTGSGAIALALACERPQARVDAVDASADALAVARRNAARLGLRNVALHHGDWFAPLAGMRYDLVASNPPYIARHDPHLREGDLRFEPAAALASGDDGLDAIRRIARDAPGFLAPGGWLLLEHGWDQGDAVRALLHGAGLAQVETYRDLEGRDRACVGRMPA